MGSTLRMRTAASTRLWWATPEVGLLLVVTAATWLWTVVRSGNPHAMPGAMGLTLPAFLLMWAPMVTAMMLPAVAPVASLYARSVERQRRLRLGGFAAGYLLVWVASGLPAYGLARLADRAVAAAPDCRHGGRGGRLRRQRRVPAHRPEGPLPVPLPQPVRPAAALCLLARTVPGPAGGAHSGAYCLGCCWSLMALMIAFGVMNLWAMVVLLPGDLPLSPPRRPARWALDVRGLRLRGVLAGAPRLGGRHRPGRPGGRHGRQLRRR